MIEDIQYLQLNCEQDSAVVYIDSDTRDRNFNPYPGEYTISFDQPFKLVTGFDVLDASIPTTMWNVDKYNGTLAITLVTVPISNSSTRQAGANYFDELRDVTTFYRLYQRAHIPNEITENFIMTVTSTYYDAQAIQASEELTPYFLYVRRILADTSIKVAPKSLDLSSYYTFTYRNVLYYNEASDTTTNTILAAKNFHLSLNSNNMYDVIYFDEVNVTSPTFTSISSARQYTIKVNNYYKQIQLGNYDITSLKVQLNTVWNPSLIEFETTVTPDNKQGIYQIQSASGLVIVNATIGKLVRQIGYDTFPRSDESDRYALAPIGDNKMNFMGLYVEDISGYRIIAPGIVNLLGDRYLIVRCKEIEDHLLGSYAYTKFSPGIGLFKLAASYNDITHLRFDFVNLVRKPFHPIGKLSKLTIRFETQDGNMYDFKGINHQLLLLIKYLVPTQKQKLPKPILNPNYDGNFMRYMSTSRTIAYKEDSDNEQEFNTREYQEQYKKEMAKYDYSTSGSDTDADADADANNVEDSEDPDEDDSEVEFDFSGTRAAKAARSLLIS